MPFENARGECHVSIPQLKNPDGSINGDHCFYLPDNPVAWKKAFLEHLEGNEEAFLTIANNVAGEFFIGFGWFPTGEILSSLGKKCKHFGFTLGRETLAEIYRTIGFMLGKDNQ